MTYLTLTKLARLCDTTPDRVSRKIEAGKLTPSAKLYTKSPLFDAERLDEYRDELAQPERR